MTIQPDLIALSSGRGLRSPFDEAAFGRSQAQRIT